LPRRGGWAVIAALAALSAINVAFYDHPNLAVALIAAVVTVAAGAMLVKVRRGPLILYGTVAIAAVTVLGNGTSSDVGWFAIALLIGWCALTGRRRDALLFWVGIVSVFAVEAIWVDSDPGWAAWIAGMSLSLLGGLMVRHEFDLVAQLRAAQAGLAERAKAEERNRIARELHDVIAHTLIVSQLHVTSARLAVEHDPADAVRSLAEAERLGQETLAEVRRAVGLLREDGDSSAPLPGGDDVPALVERFRSAGADVTLTGAAGSLPAVTGLAVYRILQEALTNAVKHAPGAAIRVGLTSGPDRVCLAVGSAGAPGRGTGLGLVSMQERASAVGGSCVAGPDGPGWTVRAELPIGAAP